MTCFLIQIDTCMSFEKTRHSGGYTLGFVLFVPEPSHYRDRPVSGAEYPTPILSIVRRTRAGRLATAGRNGCRIPSENANASAGDEFRDKQNARPRVFGMVHNFLLANKGATFPLFGKQ